MPANDPAIDGIDELRELNQLFLLFLKHLDEVSLRTYGLPQTVARALKFAPAEQLDALAAFPRALFKFNLDPAGRRHVLDPALSDALARQALHVALLVSAWNLSRKSGYAARLFLRLSDPEIRLLRTMPLTDLAGAALARDLVSCAFQDAIWMWRELLTETRPDCRRRLLLIGLQPQAQILPPTVTPTLGVGAST
jgi:hypothetical protein